MAASHTGVWCFAPVQSQQIQLSALLINAASAPRPFLLTDAAASIVGTVKIAGLPVIRRVRLYREDTGALAGDMLSVSASGPGNFAFSSLVRGVTYTLIAVDDLGVYPPAVVTGLLPNSVAFTVTLQASSGAAVAVAQLGLSYFQGASLSSNVYPTLPGITASVMRSPEWQTLARQTASGREFRVGLRTSPRYVFTVNYDFLRQQGSYTELATLVGFFNGQGGSQTAFLYTDPIDNAVTDQLFATGDGVTTSFQLLRPLGGFNEAVYALNGAPTIKRSGVAASTPTDYTVGSTGIVTFTSAPASGVPLTWSGAYYWRVRFVQDMQEFEQFMQGLWQAKTVKFISVKP